MGRKLRQVMARVAASPFSISRAVYMIWTGAALLCLSAFMPWCTLPSAACSYVDASGELVLSGQMHWVEMLARLIVLLGGVFLLLAALRRQATRRTTVRTAWAVSAFLVCFPCWLHQWAPRQLAEGRVLYQERFRVTNDIQRSFTEEQRNWRAWQEFDVHTLNPKSIAILQLQTYRTNVQQSGGAEVRRTWDTDLLAPANCEFLVKEVLGFSDAFLGFVGWGYLLSLGGALVVLIAVYLAGDFTAAEVRKGLAWGIACLVVFFAAPLIPRCVGEFLLVRAEAAQRRGDYGDAIDSLRSAGAWKGSLRASWWYYDALGRLAKLRDHDADDEARLADAYASLRARRAEAALDDLRRVEGAGDAPLDMFFGATLAEAGMDAFQHGQNSLAKEFWEESLQCFPTNPTPWYGLSLVHLRLRQPEAAARCMRQVARLDQAFRFVVVTLTGQRFKLESWMALRAGDCLKAHEAYSRNLLPDTW